MDSRGKTSWEASQVTNTNENTDSTESVSSTRSQGFTGKISYTKKATSTPLNPRAPTQDLAPRSASRVQDLITKLEDQERKHSSHDDTTDHAKPETHSCVTRADSKASSERKHLCVAASKTNSDEDIFKSPDRAESTQDEKVLQTPSHHSVVSSGSRSTMSPISPFFDNDDLGFLEQKSYFANHDLSHYMSKTEPKVVTTLNELSVEKKSFSMENERQGKGDSKTQSNAITLLVKPIPRFPIGALSSETSEDNHSPPTIRHYVVSPDGQGRETSHWTTTAMSNILEWPVQNSTSEEEDFSLSDYGDEDSEEQVGNAIGNNEYYLGPIPTTGILFLDNFLRRSSANDQIRRQQTENEEMFHISKVDNTWRNMRSYLWMDIDTDNPHCPEPASTQLCKRVESKSKTDGFIDTAGNNKLTNLSATLSISVPPELRHSQNSFPPTCARRRTTAEIDTYMEMSSLFPGNGAQRAT